VRGGTGANTCDRAGSPADANLALVERAGKRGPVAKDAEQRRAWLREHRDGGLEIRVVLCVWRARERGRRGCRRRWQARRDPRPWLERARPLRVWREVFVGDPKSLGLVLKPEPDDPPGEAAPSVSSHASGGETGCLAECRYEYAIELFPARAVPRFVVRRYRGHEREERDRAKWCGRAPLSPSGDEMAAYVSPHTVWPSPSPRVGLG
jgi:hypothetical protein